MLFAVHVMDNAKEESVATVSNLAVIPSLESLRQDEDEDVENSVPAASPALSPPESIRKLSEESVEPPVSIEATLRRVRPFPVTPSSYNSGVDRRRESTGPRIKSAVSSISSISDFNGSEDSHTERRFLRHYEELECHCSEPFPDFITPWFLRRVNFGPCKAGDVVDLLRFLRPNGLWISPFSSTVLDSYLSSSLEKALYPNLDTLNAGQKALLTGLRHFVFSAYDYAQGIFFPSQGQWEEDRRDAPVDSLNLYVEDVVALVDYIRRRGRSANLRLFVQERTETLRRLETKRTFFFAEGGDSRLETEEYVFNMFLALLGLWTVGCETSDVGEVDFSSSTRKKVRFDYGKILPHRRYLMENIALIRETFGVLAAPLDASDMGIEWVQPLQDFDAAVILKEPFRFAVTRDLSRYLTVDESARTINLFYDDVVIVEDSLSRLDGNFIAKVLNLDLLHYEHKLLHQLFFSSDESRQIAFSLGLVPPRKAQPFLRLSAFPNYGAHLLSLRRELKERRSGGYNNAFGRNSWHNKAPFYLGIGLLSILTLIFILAIAETVGLWMIFSYVR